MYLCSIVAKISSFALEIVYATNIQRKKVPTWKLFTFILRMGLETFEAFGKEILKSLMNVLLKLEWPTQWKFILSSRLSKILEISNT